MKKKDILAKVIENVNEEVKEKYRIKSLYVKENAELNGGTKIGIGVEIENSNISPCIYMDKFLIPAFSECFDDNKEKKEIYQEDYMEISLEESNKYFEEQVIYALKEKEACHLEDIDFSEFEDLKDHLFLALVNFDKNRNMLQKCPYKKFLDLAIVVRWKMESESASGSMLVNHKLLDSWGISKEELFSAGWVSTRKLLSPKIENLGDFLKREIGGEYEENPMIFIGNNMNYYGAVYMLYPDLLEELYYTAGDDYYILPSSIHELLALPVTKSDICASELCEMVKEINRAEVSREECLSESVYYYNHKAGKLSIAI